MNAVPEEKLLRGMLSGVDIPPCPAILIALDAELRKETPDQREVARLISQDVALSGHVMLIANSPAFSTGRKLDSVMQAIAVLGMQSVFSMVVGHLLQVALASGNDVSMERFWKARLKPRGFLPNWPGACAVSVRISHTPTDCFTIAVFPCW